MLGFLVFCSFLSTIIAVDDGCYNMVGGQPPSTCTDCYGYCTQKFCEENSKSVDYLTNWCYKTCYACNGQSSTDAPIVTDAPASTDAPAATNAPIATSGGSCGVQDILPSINLNGYIVGGTEAEPNSWPWAIRLFINGYSGCGGTIINERWVVTAAHCIGRNQRYMVGVGYHTRNSDKNGYNVNVVKTFVHEDYNPRGRTHDDVALLKLSTPLKFSKYVQPVCLPESGYKFDEEQPFVSVGWGSTKSGGYGSNELRQVIVPLISDDVCSQWVRMSKGKEFCAGYAQGGKDSCQGDSGGGVVFKKDNRWYQGGIVSWGYGCAKARAPGLYTYVPRYMDWINKKIANN